VAKRCRFIIEENQRVLDLAQPLSTADREALRQIFDASWLGATRLFEIGAPSMEAMHDSMTGAPGLIARRQAGAGFGGCLVAIVDRWELESFAAHVEDEYRGTTGIDPSVYGVEASAGAGRVDAA